MQWLVHGCVSVYELFLLLMSRWHLACYLCPAACEQVNISQSIYCSLWMCKQENYCAAHKQMAVTYSTSKKKGYDPGFHVLCKIVFLCSVTVMIYLWHQPGQMLLILPIFAVISSDCLLFPGDPNQMCVPQFLCGVCVVLPGNPTQRQRCALANDPDSTRVTLLSPSAALSLPLKMEVT